MSMGKLKNLYRRLRYGDRMTSEEFIARLRSKGMTIGEDVHFYDPKSNVIDTGYPWMITIGDHVNITHGVIMLTHDYSWSVLKRMEQEGGSGQILAASGEVVIGDNVFIGMNAILLPDVHVGSNVIIGAGSVVTHDCESDWVYAGSPAKKIMPVEEYYRRRKQGQLAEAKKLAVRYREVYGENPGPEIFDEYFLLFTAPDQLTETFREKLRLCGNYDASLESMEKNPPMFASFGDFLKACGL